MKNYILITELPGERTDGMRFLESLIAALVILLGVCIQTEADKIVLSNGQSAPTTVLDTAGCDVTIERRGKETKIKKEVIDRVIWNADTIDYTSYKCEEKAKKVVRFSETPEYKLMAFIDNCPELEQEFEEGRDVAYLIAPLQGEYNADEFMSVHKALLEVLAQVSQSRASIMRKMLCEIDLEKAQGYPGRYLEHFSKLRSCNSLRRMP